MKNNREIEKLRKQIDQLDEQIVKLLNERAALALEVNQIKLNSELPVFDPEREQRILEAVSGQVSDNGSLPPDYIKKIYSVILDCMKDVAK